MILKSLFMALLLVGCATKSPQTNHLLKNHLDLPEKHHIADVPFLEQDDYLCAPASLGMVLSYEKRAVNMEKLKSAMMTPKSKGTYQTDLLSSARGEKMLAVEINGVKDLLKEISEDHPVIVFQNVGLESLPTWHYAVATGYDLKKRKIYLHSGKNPNKKEYLKIFEETWSQGGYWGLVVLPPQKLSSTGSEIKHAEAAAGLENQGFYDEALEVYQNILTRWPKSLLARIGLGNVYYYKKQYSQAVKNLKVATIEHPDSKIAQHNLEIALKAYKKGKSL